MVELETEQPDGLVVWPWAVNVIFPVSCQQMTCVLRGLCSGSAREYFPFRPSFSRFVRWSWRENGPHHWRWLTVSGSLSPEHSGGDYSCFAACYRHINEEKCAASGRTFQNKTQCIKRKLFIPTATLWNDRVNWTCRNRSNRSWFHDFFNGHFFGKQGPFGFLKRIQPCQSNPYLYFENGDWASNYSFLQTWHWYTARLVQGACSCAPMSTRNCACALPSSPVRLQAYEVGKLFCGLM